MKLKHYGKVIKGKFRPFNTDNWIKEFQSLEGENIEVVVRKETKSRSDNQNRYYWGVVVRLLSNELGYTTDEIHEVLKYKFLGYKEIVMKDETIKTLKSTSILSTLEMEQFLTDIRNWSLTLNINIPLPNEVEY